MSETATTPDCCSDDANFEEQDSERDDLVVRVCQVCGRRHFELNVDPFEVGVEAT